MAKKILIKKCTLCHSENIKTDSQYIFECLNCGVAWEVIMEENKDGQQKALPKTENKSEEIKEKQEVF